MTTTVTLAEAQSGLAELIRTLAPGQEVVIVEAGRPVAKLVSGVPDPPNPPLRPPPGLGKGWITVLEDDDAHLEDFKEYMP